MPKPSYVEALTTEPVELSEEQYWNQWVAIGKMGIVAADPNLSTLLDDLKKRGVVGNVATTLFNTPPSGATEIPTPFFSDSE